MEGISIMIYIIKIIYDRVLRPLLKKAVEDPDEKWDDHVLHIIDKIFDHKED